MVIIYNIELLTQIRLIILVILTLILQVAFVIRHWSIKANLPESERRLASVIDTLPGIVYSCSNDPDWSMTYLSAGCLELTGYHSAELVKIPGAYNAITHREDLGRVLQTIEVAVASKQAYMVEYRITTKSGAEKWLWEKGNGIFNGRNQVLGLEGFITDITKLKQSQAALEESELRYRELFESHTHPMYVYDCETLDFLAVNKAAVEYYGYSQSEFLTMTLGDIQLFGDIPTLVQKSGQVESAPEYVEVWQHRQKNGTLIHVEISYRQLVFAGKGAEVVSVNDITKRLQTEEALQQAVAKYRSFFENAVEGIYQTTTAGQYISANRALARICGYGSPQALIAAVSNIEQQLYAVPEQRMEFIRLMQQHDVVANFEAQIYRQDGSVIWISETARHLRDVQGVIIGYEGTVEDITERKRREARLAYLANHDSLTGLVNRRYFQQQLEQHLTLAQRDHEPGAVVFIDLDGFKSINDTLGHQAGDELLQNLAILLQKQLRPTDVLARLGGDEFAIVLPRLSAKAVRLITRRLLKALERHVFVVGGQPVQITASIGATFFPSPTITAEELLSQADTAMYQSKVSGRNRLSVYQPTGN